MIGGLHFVTLPDDNSYMITEQAFSELWFHASSMGQNAHSVDPESELAAHDIMNPFHSET